MRRCSLQLTLSVRSLRVAGTVCRSRNKEEINLTDVQIGCNKWKGRKRRLDEEIAISFSYERLIAAAHAKIKTWASSFHSSAASPAWAVISKSNNNMSDRYLLFSSGFLNQFACNFVCFSKWDWRKLCLPTWTTCEREDEYASTCGNGYNFIFCVNSPVPLLLSDV